MPETYDFSDVPEKTIDEFHRQAELYLDGSIKLAIAADSRATALTATLGAASAALVVLGSNLFASASYNQAEMISVFVVAFILFAGASFCAVAAKPIAFYVTGFEPAILHRAALSDKIWDLKIASAESIQLRIDKNDAALLRAAQILAYGRTIAFSAIPAGLITFFCLSDPAWIYYLLQCALGLPAFLSEVLELLAEQFRAWAQA